MSYDTNTPTEILARILGIDTSTEDIRGFSVTAKPMKPIAVTIYREVWLKGDEYDVLTESYELKRIE